MTTTMSRTMSNMKVYVTKGELARNDLRKSFAKEALSSREDAIASLTALNDIAADHKYDAMSIVLSILSGMANAPEMENRTAKDIFQELLTLFTSLDIVMEVRDDFLSVLTNGQTELLQDTLMRKFEEYSEQ